MVENILYLQRCEAIVNWWWMQSFLDDIVLTIDNTWMLDIIEEILKRILGMDVFEEHCRKMHPQTQ